MNGSNYEDIGTKVDLAKYRIETAEHDINSAELLFTYKEYCSANNRAYYAVFHAISAIHALDGNTYKRHKDAIANFNKNYVKTGIFSREIGHKIAHLEEVRHASDYDDFYIAKKSDTKEQIEVASNIVESIKNYCNTRIYNSKDVAEKDTNGMEENIVEDYNSER